MQALLSGLVPVAAGRAPGETELRAAVAAAALAYGDGTPLVPPRGQRVAAVVLACALAHRGEFTGEDDESRWEGLPELVRALNAGAAADGNAG